jgi:hypothetical protein
MAYFSIVATTQMLCFFVLLLFQRIIQGFGFDFGPLNNVHLEPLKTFSFTGEPQLFEVPFGFNTIFAKICGGKGGDSSNGGIGGKGGCVTTFLDAFPGQKWYIFVGGPGGNETNPESGGFNGGGNGGIYRNAIHEIRGGGGGGASDIRLISTDLKSRLVVAGGGGGGASFAAHYGGSGGGGSGGNYEKEPSSGGKGGTIEKGGDGGKVSFASDHVGFHGKLGQGGNGAANSDGGGGGGGYYGGGGGAYAGGGGGSSNLVHSTFTSLLSSIDHRQNWEIGLGDNSESSGSVSFFVPCPLNTVWETNRCSPCPVGMYTPIHGASCIPLHKEITYDSSLPDSFSFYFIPNHVNMLLVEVWECNMERGYAFGEGGLQKLPPIRGDVVTAYVPVSSNNFIAIIRNGVLQETSIVQYHNQFQINFTTLISLSHRYQYNSFMPMPLFPGWIRNHQFNINAGPGKVILRPACAPGTYRKTIGDVVECIACESGTYSLFPDSVRCISPGDAIVLPYASTFAPYWMNIPKGVKSIGMQVWGAGGSAATSNSDGHILYGGGAG